MANSGCPIPCTADDFIDSRHDCAAAFRNHSALDGETRSQEIDRLRHYKNQLPFEVFIELGRVHLLYVFSDTIRFDDELLVLVTSDYCRAAKSEAFHLWVG